MLLGAPKAPRVSAEGAPIGILLLDFERFRTGGGITHKTPVLINKSGLYFFELQKVTTFLK